jgi:Kef-type K+ transport system membrane component KefB/nucleotide-binding universal stress UspA family protein
MPACLKRCLLGALFAALIPGGALAAESGGAPSEVIFLAELMVLMLVGRILGEVMQRIGQPSVMGMLIGGILLGPAALGLIAPDLQMALFPKSPAQKSMLDAISQFGILLLLLLTGMETDLKLVRKVGKAAISISITGVAVPFVCGFALGQFIPDSILPHPDQRLLTSLFLGTALSISSIKIVAAIVREMNFTRRNLGQVIVASAICEDTIGWIIIAITFSLAVAGTLDVMHVATAVLGTAAFMGLSFTIGRPLVFFLIRWTNDSFRSEFPVITIILLIMGGMALITHAIGVHTVLGAFVSGVLIGESPILTRHIDEQLRGLIIAFFMPVFFGAAGLTADLTILVNQQLLFLTLGLIAIASFGKFAGAFIGGKIGGLTQRESLALACGMNARGSTEVIVATIGLSMGVLSQNLFTMIVAMALITTMAMPPMLRWALKRVPLGKTERERLELEEFEAKGFVPNLERLLLAVDDSPNGKLAAHLAGLIAGPRGMSVTVLPMKLAVKPKMADTKGIFDDSAADVIKASAESAKRPEENEKPPTPPNVTVRARALDQPSVEAVASEARKGYDLLVVGLANTRKKSGGFHEDVAQIASAFEGPLAVVMGRDPLLKSPQERPSNILVPVNGTEPSRRAAEVAIAIARVCAAQITALYVSGSASGARGRRPFRSRRQEQAFLKEIVDIAERYDVDIKSTIEDKSIPDRAIVTKAKQDRNDLIVMGVTRRTGETLDFGETAAAVLENAQCSIVLLAT